LNGKIPESTWTFITNHAVVLSSIAHDPIITARMLAETIGITERAVRRIITDLFNSGYIGKTKEGRRVRYTINYKMPLRHRTQKEKAVSELIKLLALNGGSDL
jgi:DNA-binding transcriptional regulator PaaX